jgi:hypothetical protein
MGKKPEAVDLLEHMQGLPIVWHQNERLKEAGRQMLKKLRKPSPKANPS